jgi:hypothetical protein
LRHKERRQRVAASRSPPGLLFRSGSSVMSDGG